MESQSVQVLEPRIPSQLIYPYRGFERLSIVIFDLWATLPTASRPPESGP